MQLVYTMSKRSSLRRRSVGSCGDAVGERNAKREHGDATASSPNQSKLWIMNKAHASRGREVHSRLAARETVGAAKV
eukprot:2299621-Pleurochrysis_carterae.AAC.4